MSERIDTTTTGTTVQPARTSSGIDSTLCPVCRFIGGGHDDTGCSALREPTQRELARLASQRVRWADKPDFISELEADLRVQLSRPAPPACPEWCDEPNHDGYGEMSGEDEGRQMLSHSTTVGDAVFIVVDEYREPDDTVTRDVPFIHTYLDGQDMTPDQAEAHGQALLKASAKLREIVGDGVKHHHDHDSAVRAVVSSLRTKMPECPSWCAENHDDLVRGVDVVARTVAEFHRSTMADIAGQEGEVAQVFLQRFDLIHDTGQVEVGEVVVALRYTGDAGFSPSETRRLAAWLSSAADEVAVSSSAA